MKKTLLLCAALVGSQLPASNVCAATVAAPANSSAAPANASLKVAVRRLTESQYRHIVADTFGSDIKISARFERRASSNILRWPARSPSKL